MQWSQIINVDIDYELYHGQYASKVTEPKDEQNFIDALNSIFGCNLKDLDDAIKYITNNMESAWFQGKMLFSNPVECWQILGFGLVNDNDKRILYVNKMSDFSLYSQMGIPIRSDHLGSNGDNSKELSFIRYNPPLDVYAYLFEVHGSSLSEYMIKLMYPEGVIPALKAEYAFSKRYMPEKTKQDTSGLKSD